MLVDTRKSMKKGLCGTDISGVKGDDNLKEASAENWGHRATTTHILWCIYEAYANLTR